MTINLTMLGQLLLSPQETLDIELKNWLSPADNDNRSKIAKELLALANNGGGYLIFGFVDKTGEPDTQRPQNLQDYSPDTINSIVRRFADPAFQCDVYHIAHPVTAELFPIVRIPGGHEVPIRCKAGCPKKIVDDGRYYTRLPGPESGVPRNHKDWDDIIKRCVFNKKEALLSNIRSMLTVGPQPDKLAPQNLEEHLRNWITSSEEAWNINLSRNLSKSAADYYGQGNWSIAYRLIGAGKEVPIDRLELIMRSSPGQLIYPSWNIAKENQSKRTFDTDNSAEWLHYVAEEHWKKAWTCYGRVSQELNFFLKGGYLEDIAENQKLSNYPKPGATMYSSNAVEFLYRTTEHAAYVANKLEIENLEIFALIEFNKVSGRHLNVSNESPDRGLLNQGELFKSNTSRSKIELKIGPMPVSFIETNFVEATVGSVQAYFRAFNISMDETRAKSYISQAVDNLRNS